MLAIKSTNTINFRIPRSYFKMQVAPKTNANILSLLKLNPANDWGEFEP